MFNCVGRYKAAPMKYRVLLHSMTFFRDYGMVYVLSRLLEKLGCECQIVSNETISERWTRLWNPHAVFYVTASRTAFLRDIYPKAKLFFCSGEGAQDYDNCDEVELVKHPDTYAAIDRIFTWGENTHDNLRNSVRTGKTPLEAREVEANDTSRWKIVGHPRLDLTRFRPVSRSKEGKVRIGFIGNCFSINGVMHPVTSILTAARLYKNICYSSRLLASFMEIFQALGTADFAFSLRPYPSEPRAPYLASKAVRSGELELDAHLDFSSWVAGQDILIGELTETFATLYSAKKPFIALTNLTKDYPPDRLVTPCVTEMAPMLARNCPETLEDLVALCVPDQDPYGNNSALYEYMHRLFNTRQEVSSLALIARDIRDSLDASPPEAKPGVSLKALRAMDYVMHLALQRKRRNSYSYFDPVTARCSAEKELEYVVREIVSHPASASCLRLAG